MELVVELEGPLTQSVSVGVAGFPASVDRCDVTASSSSSESESESSARSFVGSGNYQVRESYSIHER